MYVFVEGKTSDHDFLLSDSLDTPHWNANILQLMDYVSKCSSDQVSENYVVKVIGQQKYIE